MSVAFRRESDEEHKEPTFELPIAPGPNLVTPRGRRLIAERVAELEAQVATETDEARLTALRRDLRYWHTRLTTAELATPPAPDQAGIGARVQFRLNGAERAITIVGGDEADPNTGRLAFYAPLARARMGSEAGDLLDFNGASEAIEVLAVEPDPSAD